MMAIKFLQKGTLVLLGAAALFGCGGPAGESQGAQLPASVTARDSARTSLTAPAPDATSTGTPATDTTAASPAAARK